MRKGLLILIGLLVLVYMAVLLFIPERIDITGFAIAKTSDNGTERYLLDTAKWNNWWNYTKPKADSSSQNRFIQNEDTYHLSNLYYKSADIQIQHHGQSLTSKLVIIPVTQDSTGIEWKTSLQGGSNPFTRLANYFEARKVKKNIDEVLFNAATFLSSLENVYGIHIERTTLKDTLFVTTKNILPANPDIHQVYELIKRIQAYLSKKSLKQSGNPIYNVSQLANNQFQLMAAVPVNKRIPDADGFSLKFMVKGSFMVTEVVGGDSSISKASHNLEQYFQDFRRTSMAMNFTMLVTDRQLQPDSSKWITKLYQPVY